MAFEAVCDVWPIGKTSSMSPQMERLGLHEATMDCTELKFGLSPDVPDDIRNIPGMPRPWEMEARGGVILRTRRRQGLYEATAARATFASKKVDAGRAGQWKTKMP